MTVYPIQANMTRGELTPLAHARGDTEHYSASLAEARNVCVIRYGGITRTPGTLMQGPAKNSNKSARFIKFQFKRSQVYAIEAGDLYFRFWIAAGQIESSPGVPVEVATPYAEADLKNLRVRQSGDVLYIWCAKTAGGAYQPMTLTRTSETVWTLAEYNPKGGPFLKEETEGTILTPAGYGSPVPVMTNNTSPSGTAALHNGHADAWKVFDKDKATDYSGSSVTTPGWISYDFAGAATYVVDAYYMTCTRAYCMPKVFTIDGYDGANWITLDTRTAEIDWSEGETRYYDFPNETAYQAYRMRWTALNADPNDVGTTDNLFISELHFHQSADTQTAFNLTASSINGINDNTGFQSSDVGRVIRLLASDGRWRTATIAARTSTTVVTVTLDDQALPDLSPIARWQFGAFSDYSGWPHTGAIYEDRLVHANTDKDPLGLWTSRSADYDDMSTSVPIAADDAVSIRLTGGGLDEISWLSEQQEDMVGGTAASLRAVGRNNQNEAFGPSNVRQRAQTLAPASTAEPLSIENILLFIDFYEQRLYEAAYTYEVDGYLAREASTLNEHLFAAGVAEICYLSHPHKIVVARRYDGKLIFFTYDREQKVAGGTLVDFGGVVESVMDLSGDTMTDLWMVIQREVDGGTVRYVERLAEFWRADYTVQDVPVYYSCATIYDGAATNTITDADYLEGETVGIWADGRDIGDAVVTGGEFDLPGAVEAEQIVYGLRQPWSAKTLRLTQIGNQDGSGMARSVTIVEAFIDLYEAAGVSVGSLYNEDVLTFEDDAEADPDAPVTLRTGFYSLAVDDSWRNNGVLAMSGDRGYPATIRAVQLNIDGEP